MDEIITGYKGYTEFEKMVNGWIQSGRKFGFIHLFMDTRLDNIYFIINVEMKNED